MEPGKILGSGSEAHVITVDATTVKKCCPQNPDGLHIGVFTECSVLAQYRHPHMIAPQGEKPFTFSPTQFTINLPYYPTSLATTPPSTSQDITRVAYELLSVLSFLHSHHIIHTDLKPNNILFDTQGTTRLIDFGQSLRDYGQPKPLEVQISYLRAPEVLLQDPRYTTAIDIWALGVILYDLVYPQGPRLNNGGDDDQVMREYCRLLPYSKPPTSKQFAKWVGDTPKVTELALPSSCSPDLQVLIRRCLEFQPSQRITAAQALQLPLFMSFPPPPSGEVLPLPPSPPVTSEVRTTCQQLFKYLKYLPGIVPAQDLALRLYAQAELRQPSSGINSNRLLACTYISAQQFAAQDCSQDGIFASSYCPWQELYTAVQEIALLLDFRFHPTL